MEFLYVCIADVGYFLLRREVNESLLMRYYS